jgi:hypothetical protein
MQVQVLRNFGDIDVTAYDAGGTDLLTFKQGIAGTAWFATNDGSASIKAVLLRADGASTQYQFAVFKVTFVIDTSNPDCCV